MSKLPNAPLIEIIFDLQWHIKNKSDLTKSQYLFGDLYNAIKDRYPFRESLFSPEIPADVLIKHPILRYRKVENGYPLVQMGPGILTLNTTDDDYYWDDFYSQAELLLSDFYACIDSEGRLFRPKLIFADFFIFDFDKHNANDFINQNFNINFSQSFISETNPFDLNLNFFYQTELGKLTLNIKKGRNSQDHSGIVMQTSIVSDNEMEEAAQILSWLNGAHDLASKVFRDFIKKDLYKSFQ